MCSENGTLFHTTWWLTAWGVNPVVHAVTDEQGKIKAGICFALGRRFGVKAIIRPPLTLHNGPVFAPMTGQGTYRAVTHAKKTMLSAIHGLPKLGMYDFQLRACDFDAMPFLWNGFDVLLSYVYVIPCSVRDVWDKQASKSARKELRRAAAEFSEQHYRIDDNPEPDEMLLMFEETAHVKNFRIRRLQSRFGKWWEAMRARSQAQGYILRDGQGNPLAAKVFVHDQHSAYNIIGGMRADLRAYSHVNTILLNRMIRDAHAMGLDFNFSGSILPGVEQFMRGFGGELRVHYRVVKLPSFWASLVWQGYRYWTRHRKRRWIWHD